jgi:hypothetical protein
MLCEKIKKNFESSEKLRKLIYLVKNDNIFYDAVSF